MEEQTSVDSSEHIRKNYQYIPDLFLITNGQWP